MTELKELFTKKDSLSKSIIGKMIEAGIEPMAYWVFDYIKVKSNLELKEHMLKIRDAKPAFHSDQLIQFMPRILKKEKIEYELKINPGDGTDGKVYYFVYYENINMALEEEHIYEDIEIESLSQVDALAKMIVKLDETGLLKKGRGNCEEIDRKQAEFILQHFTRNESIELAIIAVLPFYIKEEKRREEALNRILHLKG